VRDRHFLRPPAGQGIGGATGHRRWSSHLSHRQGTPFSAPARAA